MLARRAMSRRRSGAAPGGVDPELPPPSTGHFYTSPYGGLWQSYIGAEERTFLQLLANTGASRRFDGYNDGVSFAHGSGTAMIERNAETGAILRSHSLTPLLDQEARVGLKSCVARLRNAVPTLNVFDWGSGSGVAIDLPRASSANFNAPVFVRVIGPDSVLIFPRDGATSWMGTLAGFALRIADNAQRTGWQPQPAADVGYPVMGFNGETRSLTAPAGRPDLFSHPMLALAVPDGGMEIPVHSRHESLTLTYEPRLAFGKAAVLLTAVRAEMRWDGTTSPRAGSSAFPQQARACMSWTHAEFVATVGSDCSIVPTHFLSVSRLSYPVRNYPVQIPSGAAYPIFCYRGSGIPSVSPSLDPASFHVTGMPPRMPGPYDTFNSAFTYLGARYMVEEFGRLVIGFVPSAPVQPPMFYRLSDGGGFAPLTFTAPYLPDTGQASHLPTHDGFFILERERLAVFSNDYGQVPSPWGGLTWEMPWTGSEWTVRPRLGSQVILYSPGNLRKA